MSRSAQELIALLDALVPGDDVPDRLNALLKELKPLAAHLRFEDEGGVYWAYRLALDYWREPVVDTDGCNKVLEDAGLHFSVKEDAFVNARKFAIRLGFRPANG